MISTYPTYVLSKDCLRFVTEMLPALEYLRVATRSTTDHEKAVPNE